MSMTNSPARDLAARLGPVRDITRNTHGSKESITLVSASKDVDLIQAARLLAKNGTSLLRARQAIGQVVNKGIEFPLSVPKVQDLNELFDGLRQAGIEARHEVPIVKKMMTGIDSGPATIERRIAVWNFSEGDHSTGEIYVGLQVSAGDLTWFSAESESEVHNRYLQDRGKKWRDRNLYSLLETVKLDVENATRYEQGLEPITPYEMFVLREDELGISREIMDTFWRQAEVDLPEDTNDETILGQAMQYYYKGGVGEKTLESGSELDTQPSP